MVVPELPTNRSADAAGMSGPDPGLLRCADGRPPSTSTRKPSRRSDSIITSVSSLRRTSSRVQPRPRPARAARTKARLVMLLDPGRRGAAWTGPGRGVISSELGYGLGGIVGHAHQEQALGRRGRPGPAAVLGPQNLRHLGLGPVAAADVHERAGDGPDHIVQEAVGLHVQP